MLLSVALLVGCGGDPRADLIVEVSNCDSSLKVPGETTDGDAECVLDCLETFGCFDLEFELREESCTYATCAVDVWGESSEPATTFGEDQGTLSTSAEELLAKPAGNPTPDTFYGVFEQTGYGSEDHSADFLLATNDWRLRREHRKDGIAVGIECLIDVGGATDDTRTLHAFASSPIEVHDWGVTVLEAAHDSAVYNNLGFNIECSVDIPQIDMPFCVPSGVPEGYSLCVEVVDGYLHFRDIQGAVGDGGKKISN